MNKEHQTKLKESERIKESDKREKKK